MAISTENGSATRLGTMYDGLTFQRLTAPLIKQHDPFVAATWEEARPASADGLPKTGAQGDEIQAIADHLAGRESLVALKDFISHPVTTVALTYYVKALATRAFPSEVLQCWNRVLNRQALFCPLQGATVTHTGSYVLLQTRNQSHAETLYANSRLEKESMTELSFSDRKE